MRVGGPGGTLRGRAWAAHAPESSAICARFGHKNGSIFASFCLFSRRLAIVAPLAQTLVVVRVNEQLPVSAERHHVVHRVGSCPASLLCTTPAERLPEQLRGAQVISPDRLAVPAVPLCAFLALYATAMLRRVPLAISLPGQCGAAWVTTRPERLKGHGRSPPGKTKSAQATEHR